MITADRLAQLYDIFLRHSHVSTDSRSVGAGTLFFALHGASFDGNRFAADALRKGAAIAVVDNQEVIHTAVGGDEGLRQKFFLVEDTLEALQALARWHCRRLGIPILAITGTNGKTTTKELAAAVLSRKYRIYATKGNFNNHIGVPLTLLSMGADVQLGIVEMGAGAPGEIALLCDVAQPDYGLVTNVGRAHLEGFGSEEGVRKGKGELYDYLSLAGGEAFVRRDDDVLLRMAAERPGLRKRYYDSSFADGFASNLAGDYNLFNVAAAVAIGRAFGVEEEDIHSAIAQYVPVNQRSQRMVTHRNVVVADLYNANPSSMSAAIDAFYRAESNPHLAGNEILVLGDMKELGEYSAAEHDAILSLALDKRPEALYLVGPEFRASLKRLGISAENAPLSLSPDSQGVPQETSAVRVYSFPDATALRAFLEGNILVDKTILVKGSRSISLERILDKL